MKQNLFVSLMFNGISAPVGPLVPDVVQPLYHCIKIFYFVLIRDNESEIKDFIK